jgi:hypothetical protein
VIGNYLTPRTCALNSGLQLGCDACSLKMKACLGGPPSRIPGKEEPSLNRLLAGKETAATVRNQSWAGLIAAQKTIDDLAAVLVRARSAFGGDSAQISNHLEMAELDLLSARDAIEKACWDINDLTPAGSDIDSAAWSARSLPGAWPVGSPVSAVAEPVSRRRTRRPPGRADPGEGQGELFPLLHQANS